MRILGVYAFLAALAVGCSGGGDDLTFEDWQVRVEAVCSEYEPRLAELESELGDPQSLEEVVTYVDALTPVSAEYTDAIVDVGLPDQRRAEIEQVHELLEQQVRLAEDLRDAAVDGDEEAFLAVAEQLEERSDALNDAARALEVPACLSPDE
jgi:hypothetical protein